jgi:hypothetical protein
LLYDKDENEKHHTKIISINFEGIYEHSRYPHNNKKQNKNSKV